MARAKPSQSGYPSAIRIPSSATNGNKARKHVIVPAYQSQSIRNTAIGEGGTKEGSVSSNQPLTSRYFLAPEFFMAASATSGPTLALSKYQGPFLSACHANAAGPSIGCGAT